MDNNYILSAGLDFAPEPEENVMTSIFKQYESVIVESIITSFGLDFLVNDRHGGDVDTIHNVRQVGKDEKMTYKNKENQKAYDNKGAYNSNEYHKDKAYIEKNRQVSQQKKEGTLKDAYTGKAIKQNEKSDLDHVISAKEIEDDRGRVLAGIAGKDLANSDENLQVTNPRTNRSKKAESMEEYLKKHGNEYTDAQKENMLKKDAKARKSYEKKLAKEYYTSSKFMKDTAIAAGDVSIRMGIRQAFGFVFTEVWFAVKDEFIKISDYFNLGELLKAIGNGIKSGIMNAKEKYKEVFSKFKDGVLAGALSSLTTTLCNFFFTTAKNVVKIIRQTWASIVEATKVLFINPDNLQFGERMRAVVKIIATGASVVVGGVVSEVIGKMAISSIPVVGEIIPTFCGTLVTGIMSCTLLYFLDRNKTVNKLIHAFDNIHTIDTEVNYFRQQAAYFEQYAAKLMEIDIDKFCQETTMYGSIANEIENVKDEKELNIILKNALKTIGIKIPWEGDFDSFMNNKNVHLVFE